MPHGDPASRRSERLLPAISSKTSPHFGHLIMCDARCTRSFGCILYSPVQAGFLNSLLLTVEKTHILPLLGIAFPCGGRVEMPVCHLDRPPIAVSSSVVLPKRLITSIVGSNLGPLAPENHAKRRYNTQNKPKRNNSLVHRLLVRDQGVGGSNPLSPTIQV
jgi:hypothetical protein